MSKIKEKKLNSIKSEIEEIKNFIVSNNNLDTFDHSDPVNISNNNDDTFTLTEIVKNENKNNNNNDLREIKNDLQILKSTIANHEKLLKEILFKIK